MFMLDSNEPTKVAHLQKLAHKSMLNGRTCDRNVKGTLIQI